MVRNINMIRFFFVAALSMLIATIPARFDFASVSLSLNAAHAKDSDGGNSGSGGGSDDGGGNSGSGGGGGDSDDGDDGDDGDDAEDSGGNSGKSGKDSEDRDSRGRKGKERGRDRARDEDGKKNRVTNSNRNFDSRFGRVVKAERSGRDYEVRYSDGWKEEIENGTYGLKGPGNKTVIERPATSADYSRLSRYF